VAHLGVEAFDPGGLGRELFWQELQCDRLAELQIVGAINPPMPPRRRDR
jgi:hypothetical protein